MLCSSNRTARIIYSGVSWKTGTKTNLNNWLVSLSLQTREPADVIDQVTPFRFIRDYETVKVEQEVQNEFLLLFDDDELPPTANCKNVEQRSFLGRSL